MEVGLFEDAEVAVAHRNNSTYSFVVGFDKCVFTDALRLVQELNSLVDFALPR